MNSEVLPFIFSKNSVGADFRVVAAKLTLQSLDQKLTVTIKVATAIAVLVLSPVCAFLISRSIDHGERLKGIEQLLKDIQNEQKKQVPELLGTVLNKPSDISLQLAKTILRSAAQQKRVSDPILLKGVSTKLGGLAEQYRNDPAFWQTTAEMITYRSLQGVPTQTQNLLSENLPTCTEAQSTGKITKSTPLPDAHSRVTIEHGPMIYESCSITIDSPETEQKLGAYLSVGNVLFKNCLVIYNGGPIFVAPPGGGLSRVIGEISFEDCVLRFNLSSVPPPSGQEFAMDLLNGDTNRFKLPGV